MRMYININPPHMTGLCYEFTRQHPKLVTMFCGAFLNEQRIGPCYNVNGVSEKWSFHLWDRWFGPAEWLNDDEQYDYKATRTTKVFLPREQVRTTTFKMQKTAWYVAERLRAAGRLKL